MEINSSFFQQVFLGNTVLDYCWVLGLLLLGFIFQRYLSRILSNLILRLIKTKTTSSLISKEEFFDVLHTPLSRFIMLIFLYSATNHIEYPPEWNLAPKEEFGVRMFIHRSYQLFLIAVITWIIVRVVDFITMIFARKAEQTEGKQDDQIISFAKEILKIVIVIFAIFVVLGNVFGVNVSSLVAGLGIGGLALALAAKESLENLLSSFTIFFDKPFVVGDTVKIGNIYGTVEKVGFRSTRIRTLEKSYLTVPNKQMIDAALDNMSLRTFRRVSFNIGLVYGTKIDQIRDIVSDIKGVLNDHPNTNMDGKVQFSAFGASSLDIMIVYYIDTMDYDVFLEVKEDINFKIMEIVEKRNSDFAFPTQTIHLQNSN